MIYTTEIVKDKFWIVENSGIKIGTIRSCSSDEFELNVRDSDVSEAITNEHVSLSELINRYGKNILIPKETTTVDVIDRTDTRGGWHTSLADIEGYPSKHLVYNVEVIEKNGKQFYTYTKSETSSVRYAAGYYGVKYPAGWRLFYGGKLETLDTYEFVGPFKSKSAMDIETKLATKRDEL